MKIYTKTGDKGMTRLIGGQLVSKASDRVESYGYVDFLNSWVGRITAQTKGNYPEISQELRQIQNYLFDCSTDLATPAEKDYDWRVQKEWAMFLEERIDVYTANCSQIERFILPTGSLLASDCHVARTLTRNAERKVVELMWTSTINDEVLVFLNRLSDYFFALAREMNRLENVEDEYYERSGKVFR
ncbi:cob(I)alamin adenosyltransferase [Pilibacter termitis]|uniref:Corrinoid adenosyltransferase n=1 Tax=Pilibacter termitis TaxID=263852 RepID=A0A1T4K6L3_9ENTE|nr:cob(I)yrinic acid a,c-diamide adenosyltransferase [Pilibacter termitis]SJZ38098.1 cob(I)alamin adenosyltransferase [Pilibacter termitis]